MDPRVHLCDWICQTAALNGECLYRDTCQQPVMNELGHQINCIFFWENTKPCQPVQPLRTLTSTKCSVDVDPSTRAFRQAPGLLQYILCVYIYIYINIMIIYVVCMDWLDPQVGGEDLRWVLTWSLLFGTRFHCNIMTSHVFVFLKPHSLQGSGLIKTIVLVLKTISLPYRGWWLQWRIACGSRVGGLFMQAIRAMGFLV